MALKRRQVLIFLSSLAGSLTAGRWAAASRSARSQSQLVMPLAHRQPTAVKNITSTQEAANTSFKEVEALAWFRPTAESLKFWKLQVDSDQPLRATITPRQPPAGTPWQIFLLFPRLSSAYDTAVSTILQVFQQKQIPAEFMAVNFEQDQTAGIAALAAAQRQQVDAIFSVGSEATALAHDTFAGQAIPVISVCSKDPVLLGQAENYLSGSGTNFAFTSLNMPIDIQMTYLKQLRQNLKTIAVMYDRQNKSAIETQVGPLQEIAQSASIDIIEVAVNQDTARTDLKTAMPKAIAAMKDRDRTLDNSIFWITGSTAVFREIATINQLAGQLPVLSAVPDVVTTGDNSAVLSVGVSFESNAYLAALYGIDILRGQARAAELPVGLVSPPDIAINFGRAKQAALKIPFQFFESASFIYDYDGKVVRKNGTVIPDANAVEKRRQSA